MRSPVSRESCAQRGTYRCLDLVEIAAHGSIKQEVVDWSDLVGCNRPHGPGADGALAAIAPPVAIPAAQAWHAFCKTVSPEA
jgi:hypothetical protein